MSRKLIVAGNWKMNLNRSESLALAEQVADSARQRSSIEVAIFPSLLWTVPVADALDGVPVTVGIQDCFTEDSGAYTGEVSPQSAATVSTAALVGHSERRHIIGETDDVIARKLSAALRAGMTCYLCVGETLEQREAGSAKEVTTGQLAASLTDLTIDALSRLVVAYEPVWAIGTGVAATPEDAQEMCQVVRNWLQQQFGDAGADIPVLYGGSVNPDNARALFGKPDIDGGLIGGASLDPQAFGRIIEVAASVPV